MKNVVVLLVLIWVTYVKCQHHHHGVVPPPPPQPPPPRNPHTLELPEFGAYLIGIAMFIMFFIIIYLVYALQKAKSSGYKIMPSTNQQNDPEPTSPCKYERHDSSRTPIVNTSTVAITPVEEIVVEDSFLHHSESARDFHRNEPNTSTMVNYNERRVNVLSKIQKNANSMLPPDQMWEICKAVLEKSKNSNKEVDFTDSLEIRRQRSSRRALGREKSASTPELDILYDEPASVRNEISENASKNKETVERESSNELTVFTPEKNDLAKPAMYNADEIYDNLPQGSHCKRIVIKSPEGENRCDSQEYVIVIDSPDQNPNGPDIEYINAKPTFII